MAGLLKDGKGFILNKDVDLGAPEAIQPEESAEIKSLREKVGQKVPDHLPHVYGGSLRFYERFLLARDNNEDKAQKMLLKALEIRRNLKVDESLNKEEQLRQKELFEQIEKFWPIDFWGFSKEGHPVMIGKLGNIKPKEFMETFQVEDVKRFYVHFVQRGIKLQMHGNSPSMRKPEEDKWKRQVEIFDFNGISMKQLHLSGLKMLKDVLGSGQYLFPENVERSYMINAPWFFSGAWSVVKHVLDKETQKKIVISSGDCRAELLELLGSEELVDKLYAKDV